MKIVISPRMRCFGIAGALAGLLGGCATPAPPVGLQEEFGSGSMHSRLFDATPAATCEAGRRALLSQGYIVNSASADMVEGTKSFQPDPDSNVQMTIRAVCVADAANGRGTLGFVSGLQDTYILRKTNNSASLGVPAIGSVSLPFSASSEALVKVASKTVSSLAFYERFFDIVKIYLRQEARIDVLPDPPAIPMSGTAQVGGAADMADMADTADADGAANPP